MPPSCDTVPETDAADTKMADPKIVDLIKTREGEGQGPFTSLEFFPPRTDEGVKVSLCCVSSCYSLKDIYLLLSPIYCKIVNVSSLPFFFAVCIFHAAPGFLQCCINNFSLLVVQ